MSNAAPSDLDSSGPTNRTIDDENGDSVTGATPSYSTGWKYGPTCTDCFVRPDPSLAFDSSWHDVTFDPGDNTIPWVSLTFTGTAIYVYAIVPNTIPFTTTQSNVTFVLDSEQAGTFLHTPDPADDYLYNVNIFSQTGLTNDEHFLVIAPQAGSSGSYLAFDYAIYTFEDVVTTTLGLVTVTSTSTDSGPSTSPSTSTSASTSSSTVLDTSSSSSTSRGTGTGTSTSTGTNTSTSSSTGAGSSFSSGSSSGGSIGTRTTAASTSTSLAESTTPSINTKTRTTPIGPVVGGVVAGVLVALAAIVLFCILRRRQRGPVYTHGSGETSPGIDEDAMKLEPFQPSATDVDFAGHLYGTSEPISQGSLPAIATAGASAFAPSYDPFQAPRSSMDVDLRPSQNLSNAATTTYHSPLVSAIERTPAPPPATKEAMRREELSRQLQAMEQHMADLNAQRAAGLFLGPFSSTGASSQSGGSSGGANEGALRIQVETLQAEVERLRVALQQQAVWDVGTEPPPAYEGRRENGPPSLMRAIETSALEHAEERFVEVENPS